MTDITHILADIHRGNAEAPDQLLRVVYDELRKLASAKLSHEKPGQTLQPTALVHEAYLKLFAAAGEPRFEGRGHFFAAAAESMRRILVDEARRKRRPKHGGDRSRQALETDLIAEPLKCDEVLAIDEALDKLAAESAEKAELVKLRYFAAMTIPEAATALGISRATAERYWTYAKAFLRCELQG